MLYKGLKHKNEDNLEVQYGAGRSLQCRSFVTVHAKAPT